MKRPTHEWCLVVARSHRLHNPRQADLGIIRTHDARGIRGGLALGGVGLSCIHTCTYIYISVYSADIGECIIEFKHKSHLASLLYVENALVAGLEGRAPVAVPLRRSYVDVVTTPPRPS